MFSQGGHADEVYGHGPAAAGPLLPASSGEVVLLHRARRPAAAPDMDLLVTTIHRLDGGSLCAADVAPAPTAPPPDMRRFLAAACIQAAAWHAGAAPTLRAVLHILPHAIRGTALADRMACLLQETRIRPNLLELAFNEADPALDSRDMPLLVAALRNLGIRVAIDRVRRARDSLHLLHRLPATTLRLHPVLIRDMEDSGAARTEAMDAICTAHAMGAITVALGVQSAMQRDILADMQCDEAQGPLFSNPMPADAFRRALLDNCD